MTPSGSRRIAVVTIFSALSVVGSFIKLPSPLPTVAFDSLPGFFTALYFGPLAGALVLAIGHLATSLVSGFPLGSLHFLIAVGMAFAGLAVGFLNKGGGKLFLFPAVLAGIAINTGLVLLLVPFLGWGFVITFTPFLLAASTTNIGIAAAVHVSIKRRVARNGVKQNPYKT